MKSLIISGSSKDLRQKKALEIAQSQSSQFDTHIFNTTDSRGIDLAREVSRQASSKPFEGRVTTIIILESSKLTREAQNSLLKILEEPEEHLQVILTAASSKNLLATVASRLTEISLQDLQVNGEVETQNIESLRLSERLAFLEGINLEDYAVIWENKLKKAVLSGAAIKAVHSYSKLILKMIKAEKKQVNKKLIELLLALQAPKID